MTVRTRANRVIQRIWSLRRRLTLGAQGAVIASDGSILLIKHTYIPGWHFPGGGVEHTETVAVALARELEEEAGIVLTGTPELFGLYSNHRHLPNDHIALYVVRDWNQPQSPAPNHEIAAHGFFKMDALPSDIGPSTHQRIREIVGGAPQSTTW